MKKVFTIILSFILLLCCSNETIAFGIVNGICDDDEIYYEETKAYGNDSYLIFEAGNVKNQLQNASKRDDCRIISSVQRKVGVIETIDENGEIIDSHLMTKGEYRALNPLNEKISIERAIGNVGNDSETHIGGCLSIELGVVLDDDTYLAVGEARWTYKPLRPARDLPGAGYDYIALTWGGAGELKCVEFDCAGKYSNNADILFARKISNTYGGYCWQFNEQITVNPSMQPRAQEVFSAVRLQKTYSDIKLKETNIQLTYIHTYQQVTGSVSFSFSSSGDVAAGISLSGCEKQWTMQVNVGGIVY